MRNEENATFSKSSDLVITATRVINAPRTLVWEAHTNPEHIRHWIMGPEEGWTMPVGEIDLRPGGCWHYVRRQNNGTEMGMGGEFLEVEPPERLVQTESWGGDWSETTNTTVFTEEDGKTTVTITIRYLSKEARDRVYAAGMEEGWMASYDRLDDYLARIGQRRELTCS